MARVSWYRSLLSVLPLAGLIAAGLPAAPLLVGHPAVHSGQTSRGAVPGSEARYPARTSSMSASGSVVTFSENVGAPQGTSLYLVFARDLARGVTQRVSRGLFSDGSAAAPGTGVHPFSAVSADGRYVAFAQYTDVPRFDVLLYDLATQASRQVSVGPAGAAPNGHSFHPALSADGAVVAFESAATNLVPGDTNDASDIFVSTAGGPIRRVSVGGSGQGDGNSHQPAISADGRYVAFISAAANLVPGDTNDLPDVFVRDLTYGITNRVSMSTAGRQANGASFDVAISADGRYVVYDSVAGNLVGGDSNLATDVFVRDLRYGITNRVSLNSASGQGNSYSAGPAVSADGRYVAFTSAASNLVSGDTNARSDVFVRDIRYGLTYRVSLGAGDTQPNGASTAASISADGRFVAFTSAGSNLVSADSNGVDDGFVRDRWGRTTVRATVDTDPF
jgi:Tol biopolymer transport system component